MQLLLTSAKEMAATLEALGVMDEIPPCHQGAVPDWIWEARTHHKLACAMDTFEDVCSKPGSSLLDFRVGLYDKPGQVQLTTYTAEQCSLLENSLPLQVTVGQGESMAMLFFFF